MRGVTQSRVCAGHPDVRRGEDVLALVATHTGDWRHLAEPPAPEERTLSQHQGEAGTMSLVVL